MIAHVIRVALIVLAATAAATAQSVPPDVAKELAPGGKLRAAINLTNSVLAQENPGGDPKGVSVDLSRELARRLGVPVEFVIYRGAGTVFADAKSGKWNVAYFAIEPVRAADVDFTPPYVLIEGGYAVLKNSPIKTIADADREGVRIAVGQGSAYDLYLTRTLKQAKLVRATAGDGSYFKVFLSDKLEAVAGVKPVVVAWAKSQPTVRVVDGAFMEIRQAMGTPKGRSDATLRYLRGFVEEMKASGFVADALKRSNQPDAAVAPPVKLN
jgi:polar amino acid transport system substrate-binding protein